MTPPLLPNDSCPGQVSLPPVDALVPQDEPTRQEDHQEDHQHEQQDERAWPQGKGLQEPPGQRP